MDARITEKHDATATIEITVPVDVVDATFERVMGSLARQVRVPGFRPGKAPRGVLLQRVGPEALAEEVREALVDDHYARAVQELNLTPVHAHFHGDPPAAGRDFTFTVHADLYPEFTLPDIEDIVIDTPVAEVSDEDVQGTVDRLREDNATLVPVDRAVAEGDVVYVETEGGGQAMPVDLGRTEPALVAQLLGRSVGEELVLDLGEDEVPADAAVGEDAAPPAATDDTGTSTATDEATTAEATDDPAAVPATTRRTLPVKVTDVKQKDRPDPDDAFAATLGFASWSEVEAEIRRGVATEREREGFKAQREELVDKLVAATDVALPPSLVRRREGHLLEDLGRDLERRGTSLTAYLERLEADDERAKFEADLRAAAERGVKRDLILERLLEVRGTQVSDAELQEALRHLAQRERKDVARFKRDQGEAWIENYRFLLARDRALDEVLREKTGRAPADRSEAAAAAEVAASTTTDAAANDDD